jgi:hypothetical protein
MRDTIQQFIYALIFVVVTFCPLIAWFAIYGG